ncbi:hypothetical protein [Fictibacillus sp. S7]|uniref:hypothetical protein n=1 Tax=Fictibacillus sp. S7 TaxID=2212476 RepID=UPI001012172E|nr:hypothetical protein [Fictibacillus sp. S7]RXY98426.1 hypothetical protein DMO16_01375 [Fictibacillus sp. S7]
MKFLTTETLTELEIINNALKNEGLEEIPSESGIKKLGEGAWHFAYLIDKEQLVLRIPKKIAYDKKVVFNREEFIADYAATKAFYKQANRAKKGICPEHFEYFVNEELTYTIESYVGKSIGLGDQTTTQSKRYGTELGEFFLALENLDPPYKGLGYLKIGEKGEIKGELEIDLREFILEETKEYQDELDVLLSSPYEFNKKKVIKTAKDLISVRSIDREKIILTNQDTSPENIIFSKNGARIIDPYPLLYTGTSLAANYVFNYQTFFYTVHNTLRYRKSNYYLHIHQLRANAEGFIEGYTNGSKQKSKDLNVEVFLKLVTMAYTHYQLLNKESLSREQIIRYGTKEQLKERLEIYLKELEKYPLD